MNKVRFFSGAVLILAILISPISLRGEEELGDIPIFVSQKIFSPPVIDGKLDETSWQEAPSFSDFWGTPLGAEEKVLVNHLSTSVKILHDEDNLYVAFDCPEPLMERVLAEDLSKDDDKVLVGERVEVALDIGHSHDEYYLFITNAAGSQYDVYLKAGEDSDKTWGIDWDSAVDRRDDGWSVEIKIPFAELSERKAKTWGAQFIRRRSYGLTEKSATSLSWGSIYVPPYWGDLYFEKPAVYFEKIIIPDEKTDILRVAIMRAESFSGKVILEAKYKSGNTVCPTEESIIGYFKSSDSRFSIDFPLAPVGSYEPDTIILTAREQNIQNDIFTLSYPLRANEEVSELIKGVAEAEKRLEVHKHSKEAYPEALVACDYLISRIRWLQKKDRPSFFLKRKDLIAMWRAQDDLQELNVTLDLMDEGKNPFASERGVFVRTYYSEVDRTRQPYRLFIPRRYDEDKDKKYPLCLYLHGWYGSYRSPAFGFEEEYLDSPDRDMFVAVLNGRGSLTFRHQARTELLDVLQDIRKTYNIDEERIYVAGHSQGGEASLFLARRLPDKFTALALLSGFFGFGFLENVTAPLSIHQGDADISVPCDFSRIVYQELKDLGKEVDYYEYAGAGHGIHDFMIKNFNLPAWLLEHKRKENPKEITFVCDSQLRYNRSFWVEINGLLRQAEKGKISARLKEGNVLEVETTNVSSFHLDLDKIIDNEGPVTVIYNGKKTIINPPFSTISLGEEGRGPAKRPKLSGPCNDVYYERFLYVWGSAGTDEEAASNQEAALKLAEWRHSVTEPSYNHLIRKDTEITDEDIKDANLVLIGGPGTNLITEQIADALPVAFTKNSIVVGKKIFTGEDIGIKVVYPNPLNREKYILLYASSRPEGMKDLDRLPRREAFWQHDSHDILVFDSRSKVRNYPRYLFKGHFNRMWQIEDDEKLAGFTGDSAGLLNFAADSIRETCGADLALISGELRVKPQEGIITRTDVESNFSDRRVAVVTLKGKDINDMFLYWAALPKDYRLYLAISGFKVNPQGDNISNLEKEKYYTLAVDPGLVALSARHFDCSFDFILSEHRIRDIVREKLFNLKKVTFVNEERILERE